MYCKDMRFSWIVFVLCLGFSTDIMAAPSVRVLGGGVAGTATSGTTVTASGATGLSGTKAVPVNTANRVNNSVLGAGNLATKKAASMKVGSTPAATVVQPIARTTANANAGRVGTVSANAVNGTGRLSMTKLMKNIQTAYQPVQVTTPTETTKPAPEINVSDYYTKDEIDVMLSGFNPGSGTDDGSKQDKLNSENVVVDSDTSSKPLVSAIVADDGIVTITKSDVTIPVGSASAPTARATIWVE